MSELRRAMFLVLLPLLLANVYGDTKNQQQAVTYDGRSIIINGSRELLFSGSVHYPRSTPAVSTVTLTSLLFINLPINFNEKLVSRCGLTSLGNLKKVGST